MVTQVLVVGAGPVGLTMAIELARYKVPVRIVDKASERNDKSKALVVWSRTMELLERAGCTGALIDAGIKVLAMNMLSGSKTIARLEMDNVPSEYRFALMIPQSETERILEETLNGLGVTVERGVELTGFAQQGDKVVATLRHADGHDEQIAVDWLVGCDGARSTIRQHLGASFLGSTNPVDWILADVHLTGFSFPQTEIATFWHKDGPLVFFPISGGRYRIVGDNGPSVDGPVPMPSLGQIQAILDQRGPGGVTATDPVWLSGFRINERQVTNYRFGRVFLAGDAAHIHSPAGGQGMNTGMQDALNLGWKLALVCHGRAPADLLDSYTPERHPVGAEVIAASARLTALVTIHNPVAQTVRNLAAHFLLGLPPVRRNLTDTLTEVSVGYPDSPLNGPHVHTGGPRPGARVRPVAGQVPFGAGDTPRFAVLGADDGGFADVARRHGALLEPQIRPAPAPGGVWLVRPDGYAAMVATEGDWQAVSGYLDRLGGRAA